MSRGLGLCTRQALHCPTARGPQTALETRTPEIRDHLPGLSKDDSPHLLASQALELLAWIYMQDYHIYTDGSVLEDGSTGAGAYLDAVKTSISLKLSSSPILTAELTAILAALQVLDMTKSPPKTVTILSDTRSSLQVLDMTKSLPKTVTILSDTRSWLQVLDMTKSPPKTVTILSDTRSSLQVLDMTKSLPKTVTILSDTRSSLQVLDMTKSPPKTVTILSDSRSSQGVLSSEYCKSLPTYQTYYPSSRDWPHPSKRKISVWGTSGSLPT